MTTDLPQIQKIYPTLPSMLKKFDRLSRKDAFCGRTVEEFTSWQAQSRKLLQNLLGLDRMEKAPLCPEVTERIVLSDGIIRERVLIQTEPDVWMPMVILIPENADETTRIFLCPPGHNGAGKFSVAGYENYSLVADKILHYQYDYGMQLARLGYVAVCPDARGFGERRENLNFAHDAQTALKGDCFLLSHMCEPLGMTVAGLLVWDLLAAIRYLKERGTWHTSSFGCLGFSGGGMQTLYLSALCKDIDMAVISGYFYGFRDSLLILNSNCSCNYIPHLWEHFDMGDLASLIAPRPLWIQSCRDDRLNGPRGLQNVMEQMDILQSAYHLLGADNKLVHEICEGGHSFHREHLQEHLTRLQNSL